MLWAGLDYPSGEFSPDGENRHGVLKRRLIWGDFTDLDARGD
jgi:hypothetical protein